MGDNVNEMDQIKTALDQGAVAFVFGLVGRFLHVASARDRRLSWSLLWELPLALGMGYIGQGVADYLALSDGFPQHAMVIGVAYIGPRIIDEVIYRFFSPR